MIKNLSGIDTNREEGRLLLSALSILTTTQSLVILKQDVNGRNTTPDEMISILQKVASEIYPNHIADAEKADIPEEKPTFEMAIRDVINRYSMENGSNTPDYILAKFLNTSLYAFDNAVKSRDMWYGVKLSPLEKQFV